MINQNISGVNVKQINISPVLSSFSAAAVQAGFYEQYRVRRVNYRVLPLATVNQAVPTGATFSQLDIPILYIVPTFTSQLPIASESSYLSYKNVQCHLFNTPIARSFVPFCQTGVAPNSVMMWSPILNASNLDIPLMGHSLLFVKRSNFATPLLFNIFVSIEV